MDQAPSGLIFRGPISTQETLRNKYSKDTNRRARYPAVNVCPGLRGMLDSYQQHRKDADIFFPKRSQNHHLLHQVPVTYSLIGKRIL